MLTFRRTFAIAIFIGLFAMAARNVLDPDVWWHLKTGEWMMQHRSIPHADPFSYTRAGQPWVAHEWLSELIIFGLFRLGGYAALVVFFACILSASFIPLYLRCTSRPAIAGAVTVWGALATAVVWGVRPQIFSLLLISIWLWLLERSEEKPKLLWWTLPLTILWVNLHAGFIVGPVFLALFLVGELVETFLNSKRFRSPHLRWLSLALAADLSLVPLNPNGVAIFKYPFETLHASAMQNHISEWASPNFHSLDYSAFFFLILAIVAIYAFSTQRLRPRDALLLLVATMAALSSARMIPLFVMVAVPLASRALDRWFKRSETSSARSVGGSGFAHAAILLALFIFAVLHTSQVIRRQRKTEAAHFPAGAVAYLRRHPPAGHIFNHYNWGGYLIFNLYPSIPVFIDGRADIYGDDMLLEFSRAFYLQDAWEEPLLRWKVTTVIVPPDSSLASALRITSGWKLEYEDSIAAIFSRP
ncbi:MAG TPA: hypothetical protein VI386_23865 [Candidatus Sulfotelmatobacter sp.]